MCWLIHLIGNVSSFPAYFPFIGRLNQLLVLSQQVNEDVKHLGSHKYIAHQLSAIYVSLFDLIFIHIILSVHKKHKKSLILYNITFFFVSITASAKLFQRLLAIIHHKKGYWGQFQRVKDVSFERGWIQAGSSVASTSRKLVRVVFGSFFKNQKKEILHK